LEEGKKREGDRDTEMIRGREEEETVFLLVFYFYKSLRFLGEFFWRD
jgi:hypothetical protein